MAASPTSSSLNLASGGSPRSLQECSYPVGFSYTGSQYSPYPPGQTIAFYPGNAMRPTTMAAPIRVEPTFSSSTIHQYSQPYNSPTIPGSSLYGTQPANSAVALTVAKQPYNPFIVNTTTPVTFPRNLSTYNNNMLNAYTTQYGSQSAVGHAFHPSGTEYIPPYTVLKDGLHTIYDRNNVPTFESPVVFNPNPIKLVEPRALPPIRRKPFKTHRPPPCCCCRAC